MQAKLSRDATICFLWSNLFQFVNGTAWCFNRFTLRSIELMAKVYSISLAHMRVCFFVLQGTMRGKKVKESGLVIWCKAFPLSYPIKQAKNARPRRTGIISAERNSSWTIFPSTFQNITIDSCQKSSRPQAVFIYWLIVTIMLPYKS